MAQSFFPAPISAQEPGGKDYKWPILKERDFQLFMKQFESPDSDPDEFFKQENITREYYEAISKKIAYNVILEASGEDKEAVKELASELGESVVFNRQEKAIYAKYKQRILKNMEDNWD